MSSDRADNLGESGTGFSQELGCWVRFEFQKDK